MTLGWIDEEIFQQLHPPVGLRPQVMLTLAIKAMNTQYRETGGIRCGSSFWNSMVWTWPFVKLSVTPEEIEFTVNDLFSSQRVFSLKKTQILSMCRERHFLFTGLRVRHSAPRYVPYILFMTFSFARLEKALRQLGYGMDDEAGNIGQQVPGTVADKPRSSG